MRRRRIALGQKPDPLKRQRVAELLRVVQAFLAAKRLVPGHIQRELVMLAKHWGNAAIPPSIVAARKLLQEAAR